MSPNPRDTFVRDRLPPPEAQPDFLFDLTELHYPTQLNAAVELLDKAVAEGDGDRIAVLNDVGAWSYAELKALSDAIANLLVHEEGLAPGQRVLLRGPNTMMLFASWFAVLKAGGVAVTTMPMLRHSEIAAILDRAEIRFAIVDARNLADYKSAASAGSAPSLMTYNGDVGGGNLEARAHAWRGKAFSPPETSADDPAIIAFTSGTTGQPKGCVHLHRDILACADSFARHIVRPQAGDVHAGTPPIAFTFGLGGLLIFPFRFRGTAVPIERASPEAVLEAIARHGVTTLYTAPTAYKAMLTQLEGRDLSRLKTCVSAGEHLPAATWEQWRARTGLRIIDGIGATEMMHIFISASGEAIRPGATGKAVPGYQACVLDDAGTPLREGTGRLAVKGPTGCRYLDDPRQADYVRGGWNLTGDIYRLDADGYFWFVARSDDMIISGGYNIAAPEVEAALLSHPAVLECAVVGEPDEQRGSIVKAFVTPAPGNRPSPDLVKLLQDHVKQHIAPYKYPRAVEFVDRLPRTLTGKLQRHRLRRSAEPTRFRKMRIACVGGGAAGLYFAISMKLRNPEHDIVVLERNRPGDTFGWGVVFSDQTMENLTSNDPVSAKTMRDELAHWDDIDIHIEDGVRHSKVTSSGHGFIGIGRRRMLEILQARARELGVDLRFETEVAPDEALLDAYDLVIASDGINSKLRERFAEHFDCDIEVRRNKFVWLGTHQRFSAFNFIFVKTEHGWIWAHIYQFDQDTATFIVECAPDTFERLGFSEMNQEETCRTCETIFAAHLGGHALMSNAPHLRGSPWQTFRRILCGTWSYRNLVLLGDAAHTAHFSIGSGTKLAFEDAIKLADVLTDGSLSAEEALRQYRDVRQLEVLKLQSAARNSTDWFEDLERYLNFEAEQFAYSLLTRSQRVSHENLRLRDPHWLAGIERWFAERALGEPVDEPRPPMFTPFRLRGLELANRIVVSPMAMYSAVDGEPTDFHLVHYGARAMGGAALVYTEMTCVSPEGRITPGCPGIWNTEQEAAWRRIVEFVHRETRARICMQLGHSGAKGSTRVAWEGIDQPLEAGNWALIAPSAVPWTSVNQTPRPMTRADMDTVREAFVAATQRAARAGFDMIELHCAHGYLLSAFISPTQNRRTDDYGGPLENRLRFPLEVFRAMRATWPDEKPMSVRISAHDWVGDEGVTPAEAVEISRAFVEAGVDIVDVSSGQVTKAERPVYGRMFQTPFADKIRNELGVATMAVGNIYEIDHVNSILVAGRADLCALARPHQMDPNWTLRAAAQLKWNHPPLPDQYLSGFRQLATNLERAGQMTLLA